MNRMLLLKHNHGPSFGERKSYASVSEALAKAEEAGIKININIDNDNNFLCSCTDEKISPAIALAPPRCQNEYEQSSDIELRTNSK